MLHRMNILGRGEKVAKMVKNEDDFGSKLVSVRAFRWPPGRMCGGGGIACHFVFAELFGGRPSCSGGFSERARALWVRGTGPARAHTISLRRSVLPNPMPGRRPGRGELKRWELPCGRPRDTCVGTGIARLPASQKSLKPNFW